MVKWPWKMERWIAEALSKKLSKIESSHIYFTIIEKWQGNKLSGDTGT